MFLSQLFVITFILGFLPIHSASCPENEVESECVSPCNTCEGRGACPPTPDCQRGCDCRPGFLRDESGECVPQQHCPGKARCPQNAVFVPCVPLVPPSCENPRGGGDPDEDDECVPGCVCRQGFLKRKDGQCVPPKQCHSSNEKPVCPKNAIFIRCGSACPPTCEDPDPKPCDDSCTTACYCKPGYLKRKDGVCVRHAECRKRVPPADLKCPENSVFISCGSPCPPTCEDRWPEPCEEKCTKACYCKPGFLLRMPDAKCVKPQLCNTTAPEATPPPECNADEQFYECAPTCQNSCQNFGNRSARCECGPPGCFCKEGLFKRADGKCVPPDQCHGCSLPGEEFQDCGPTCPDTCENRGHPAGTCPHRCIRGCFCRKGLYRTKDGRCVTLRDCDSHFTTTSTTTDAVTVPDDCHGCPSRAKCSAYCKSLGNFVGLCTGKRRRHCRCA